MQTLRKNKLRTALTGLSVSWGIFILIVLLGAGNGLKNGVMENFSERAINRITLWSGTTSMAHNGLKSGRNLQFADKEVDLIRNSVNESRLIAARIDRTQTFSFGAEYGSYNIRGVMPDYMEIEKLVIKPGEGRFINGLDVKEKNKIIILDRKIAETLFKGEEPLGKHIKVGDLMFKVVGINSKKEQYGPFRSVPFSTAQAIFNPNKKFSRSPSPWTDWDQGERQFDYRCATCWESLNFNPEDKQALVFNARRSILKRKDLQRITPFVSIIGILTLIAGIVGVSNIMLVSVKERTREIGIRKAIGAPPVSILKTIILESLIITAIFGYIGMMLGIGLTELINFVMEQSANGKAATDEVQMSVFRNPTVDIGYAIFATVVLIVSGIIAGYLPARKAVKIKPIEAMRQE